jgi:hypothetical protein
MFFLLDYLSQGRSLWNKTRAYGVCDRCSAAFGNILTPDQIKLVIVHRANVIVAPESNRGRFGGYEQPWITQQRL